METTTSVTSAVIPALRYDNAKRAVKWLCEAFGFKERAVFPGEGDAIAHAELTFDGGMIMVSSAGPGAYDKLVKTPRHFSGGNTLGLYVIVQDTDAHYTRAKKAGARILIEIADQPYGSRDYTCADPEGYVWSFGTYNPWATPQS